MDSTTLLYQMLKDCEDVVALSFNYGQRHKKELNYAKTTCNKLKVKHEVIELGSLKNCLLGNALTTSMKVPLGHYEAPSMKLTVVPNRNSLMLNIAIAKAISLGFGTVGYGAHAGDHAIYPDCRPEFLNAIQEIANTVWYEPLKILAPYIDMSKSDIVIRGSVLEVPYQNTWSCYQGSARPCLKCGTCQERTIAFRDAFRIDPLLTLAEWAEALKVVKGTK